MSKCFLFVTIFILVLTFPAKADEYSSVIDSAVKRFSTSDYRELKLAVQELVNLPEDANEALLAKFDKATSSEKITLIEIFALRKQESACPKIVEIIEFLPDSAGSRIASALDKIGDIGWKTLVKRIEEKSKKGTTRSPKLEKIYLLLVRERILNFFSEQVESRRFAYYADDYNVIMKFGKITLEVLTDMIFNKENILGNFPLDRTEKIREYVIRCLGDSGLMEAKDIILKAMNTFRKRNSYYYYNTPAKIDFSTICALSLYNLGETKNAAKIFASSSENNKKLRDTLEGIDYKFYIANMYLIVHKYDDAEKIYKKVIETTESKTEGNAYVRKQAYAQYKLATIAGIHAKREKDEKIKGTLRRKCMQSLKKAFRAGFNDFERMFLDKNIQILWNSGEFKKWIEKLRKDEEIAKLIPKWEPGKPTKLTRKEIEDSPEGEAFEPFPE